MPDGWGDPLAEEGEVIAVGAGAGDPLVAGRPGVDPCLEGGAWADDGGLLLGEDLPADGAQGALGLGLGGSRSGDAASAAAGRVAGFD